MFRMVPKNTDTLSVLVVVVVRNVHVISVVARCWEKMFRWWHFQKKKKHDAERFSCFSWGMRWPKTQKEIMGQKTPCPLPPTLSVIEVVEQPPKNLNVEIVRHEKDWYACPTMKL